MSEENKVQLQRIKFSDLHPGERFTYGSSNLLGRGDLPVFIKLSSYEANFDGLGGSKKLIFDSTDTAAQVYAYDREPVVAT